MNYLINYLINYLNYFNYWYREQGINKMFPSHHTVVVKQWIRSGEEGGGGRRRRREEEEGGGRGGGGDASVERFQPLCWAHSLGVVHGLWEGWSGNDQLCLESG